jgi:hypothetical protein
LGNPIIVATTCAIAPTLWATTWAPPIHHDDCRRQIQLALVLRRFAGMAGLSGLSAASGMDGGSCSGTCRSCGSVSDGGVGVVRRVGVSSVPMIVLLDFHINRSYAVTPTWLFRSGIFDLILPDFCPAGKNLEELDRYLPCCRRRIQPMNTPPRRSCHIKSYMSIFVPPFRRFRRSHPCYISREML